jgi:hypothetical protein
MVVDNKYLFTVEASSLKGEYYLIEKRVLDIIIIVFHIYC